MQLHKQAVPKQSARVYRLLNSTGNLTAKQIGKELCILPNTVYRAVKPLIELGMAEELATYPVSFRANPTPDAMNWYLRMAAQGFRKDFGISAPKNTDSSLPSIAFIRDRKSMLAICEQEARRAKKSINYIVSGHSIPDSTVLVYRKATTIGVKVRCIVQNNPSTTNAGLEMYDRMGVEMRYLPNIGIRLFIFDGKTAILTSYDEEQSSRAFGIRFTYAPVAEQLNELFEQRWQQAKSLS
ncbi:hypothetical protein BH23PAT1_BH23PAT1_4100 [soil metagenome]